MLSYSHSQYETVYEFNNSSAFSLPSDVSIHSVQLTPHSFPTADAVVTNITACVNIASQCGMAFCGGMLCADFSSGLFTMLFLILALIGLFLANPLNTNELTSSYPRETTSMAFDF